MMKVKVVKRFKDKKNGKIHKVNDIITISKERYEEILTVGKFVVPAEEAVEAENAEEAVEAENKEK